MTYIKLGTRKIVGIKNSRLITLPQIWILAKDVKKGDSLNIEMEEGTDKLILSKIKVIS